MSLDITIREQQEFRCPDCGRLVTTQDIGAECSGGRVWYNFLEPIGYYVPYENRTEENDWYGKDMKLTDAQVDKLFDFVKKHDLYNSDEVMALIALARFEGQDVILTLIGKI